MRALATVQTIDTISPIEGADLIVLVTFKNSGWKCVMKKDEAIEGLLVAYFEVDSLLPSTNDLFAFMESKKYRVKTIKLKGQISQGLSIPLTMFEKDLGDVSVYEDGADLTEALGVTLYEPPEAGIGLGCARKGNFPASIIKTDEERAQNLRGNYLVDFFKEKVICSQKIDGTSSTYFYDSRRIEDEKVPFGVCSRNLELDRDDENVYWKIAARYGIESKLEAYAKKHGKDMSIQGEIAGPGIQSNRQKYTDLVLQIFTAQELNSMHKIGHNELVALIDELNSLGDGEDLVIVPVVDLGLEIGAEYTVDDLVKKVQEHPLNEIYKIEGIVFKQEASGDKSFKIINPDFLLKYSL